MADAEKPEPPSRRYFRLLAEGRNTERTVFFSDAVMAIAMTLLVLEVKLPEADTLSTNQLLQRLAADSLALISCALAFGLIGLNWMLHHRKFKVIERYDGRLQRLNLLFLFFIAVLPLAVRLMIQYGDTLPGFIIYSVALALPFLMQLWIWSYAWHAKLFNDHVDLALYRYVRRNGMVSPLVFLGSIPLAFVLVPSWLALFTWFAIVPVNMVINAHQRRLEARQSTAVDLSRTPG